MPELHEFARLLEDFRWPGRHFRYGYPEDAAPDYEWMSSLERRFERVRLADGSSEKTPIYLIKEVIHWGDGSHGVAQKLELAIGDVCVGDLLTKIIASLDDPAKAYDLAKKMPGYGDTYGTKLLRFLDPMRYCALDSRIRKRLPYLEPPLILSAASGKAYADYIKYIRKIRDKLNERKDEFPLPDIKLWSARDGIWGAAHVEMALFWDATLNPPPRTDSNAPDQEQG